ncbi:protein kinase [Lactiplantibacillus sp. WILCCON 0030]|uniref:Protein kinase n=1 Tax=Lactiplantibacillus brownii TaxID=3069269 RepID=A0ABU1ADA3_9LACO|nr:protein kinase [Lactiplantibacillus brownii]MDQ7938407.1 protein kinase [Lactiplantibacillus brownii]
MLLIVQAMQLLTANTYTPLGPLVTGREFPLLVQQQQVVYVAKLVATSELAVMQQLKAHPTPLMPQIREILHQDDCLVSIETLINGQSLAARLQAQGTFSSDEVKQVALDLIQSLQHLEKLAIVHRDLKLSNIMVSNQHYYLIDISAARQHQRDQSSDTRLLGTSGFAAPENYGFAQTDGRSDIYSLGIVLNCLLTGKVPVSRQASLTQLTTAPFWRPIIEKATALDPQRRYQNATALLTAIEPPTKPVMRLRPARHWVSRYWPPVRKGLWWAYAIGWVLLLLSSLTETNWLTRVTFLAAIFIFFGLPVMMHWLNRWLYHRFANLEWHHYRGWLRAAETVVIILLISYVGHFM